METGMIRCIAFIVLVMLAVPAAWAQPSMLSHEAGRDFHYVGRLNIAGTRFCTATLITDRHVVTAAHCLYNPRTLQRVPESMMHFVAGLNRGAHAAARRIAASHVLPEFEYTGSVALPKLPYDVALLELSAPINAEDVRPVTLVGAPAAQGPLALVSYSRSRPHAPSLEIGDALLRSYRGLMVMDFAVTFGASGSPILTDGANGRQLVSIVSASSSSNGRRVALTVPVRDAVRRLMQRTGDARAPL
jgi:protease YdgD